MSQSYHFWQIKSHSYLLIDVLTNYSQPDKHNKNISLHQKKQSQGSYACRQLLKKFQQDFFLTDFCLDERQFPYHFWQNTDQFFVSFSHSRTHIAVLISDCSCIGVDVEDREISQKVAMRFFHKDEIQWLNSLSESEQFHAKILLWTLKESLIKTQHHKAELTKGLMQNCFDIIDKDQLQNWLAMTTMCNIIQQNQYVGFLPKFNCSFIMIK